MRNTITILFISTVIVSGGLLAFLSIDRNNTFEKTDITPAQNTEIKESGLDLDDIPDNRQILPEFDNIEDKNRYIYEKTKDLFPDIDEELSKTIYDNLSEEERVLQEFTSNSVGYKKLSSEQIKLLKDIKEEEKERGVVLGFKEMEAIGETDSSKRLTADHINELVRIIEGENSIDMYILVERFIREHNIYPDIVSGSGTIQAHYYVYNDENDDNIYAGIIINSTLHRIFIMKPDGTKVMIET